MAKHVAKRNFEHNKKAFKPGQELSSEDVRSIGEKSLSNLIKSGAIQKSEETKQEEPKELKEEKPKESKKKDK